MLTRRNRLIFASLLLPLLYGCGQKEASSPTPGAPAASMAAAPSDANTIVLGYSDYPAYTCLDIAQQKGIFKKHGVNVTLKWFGTYSESLSAMQAGAIDGNCQTWNDTIPMIAQGLDIKTVLVSDNSAGNDAVIARKGINSLQELRGKNVATELGTCDQYMLDKALQSVGMTEKDIHYVNIAVQDCPAAMIAGKIDACAIWEPNKSQLLKALPGSKVLYDSRALPGLIPDIVVFKSKVIQDKPEAVQNFVDSWYEMLAWWRAHPDDSVAIMAKRTETPVDFYKGFIKGSRIFSSPQNIEAFTDGPTAKSLTNSGKQIGDFLLTQKQITKTPDYAANLDDRFVKAAVAKGLGKEPPYDY